MMGFARVFEPLTCRIPFFLAVALTAILPSPYQLVIPALGLLVAGITHGALDHELDPQARESQLRFYLIYLAWIFGFLALWWIYPRAALAVFIIFSADHFGECQFIGDLSFAHDSGAKQSGMIIWMIRVWGLFAAIFSPLFHWSESLPILASLLREPNFGSGISLPSVRALSVGLSAAAILVSIYLDHYERKRGLSSIAFASTVLLFLVLTCLPLIPGFLCFFGYWHSWDSIRQQRNAKGWTNVEYFKRGIPFSILAWLGLAGLLVWGKLEGIAVQFLPMLFVVLGALSLSHSQVMKRFYRRLK